MRALVLLALPMLLSACGDRPASEADWAGDAGGNSVASVSTTGDRTTVAVPGLGASLSLPKIDIAGHMDLDGIDLYPGTEVTGVDVRDGAGDARDHVRLAFASGDAPAALADYYRREAAEAGWTVLPGADPLAIRATKGDDRLQLTLAPQGAGARGTIVLGGG